MNSLFLALFLPFLGQISAKYTCNRPFEAYNCSNYCLDSCNSHEYCPTQCDNGYYCLPNYKRHPQTGLCVPKEQCPCYGLHNEQYSDCAPACGDGCFDEAHNCNAMCKVGCTCKDKFKRKNGVCVPREKCPLCPPNERRERFNKCQDSCFSHLVKGGCSDNVQPSCYCESGLKRDLDGNCVKKCPKAPICKKKNEEFQADGVWCQDTCDKHLRRCPENDPTPGCYCVKGYARDENGECQVYYGPETLCKKVSNDGMAENVAIVGSDSENLVS